MAEAPEAEGVLQVGELLAQLVQVPVLVGCAVDLQPVGLDKLKNVDRTVASFERALNALL